ncbi:MAG: hypothetical protein IJS28_06905 [Synergistaceae bacterium]|nr:hypothetical protein [Synergistaceae bacterium]
MNEVYDFSSTYTPQLTASEFLCLTSALLHASSQFERLAKSAAKEGDCFNEWDCLQRVKEIEEARNIVRHLFAPAFYHEAQPIDPVIEARLQYLERRLDEVPF